MTLKIMFRNTYVFLLILFLFPLEGISSTTPQIAAGSGHIIALKSDGTVWTWGAGSSGQLGHPEGRKGRIVPAPIKGFNLITEVP